jgi:hypothetical protein
LRKIFDEFTNAFHASPCERLPPLNSLRRPPHAPRRIWFILRSVRLAVAHGGDDYAFVPSVAPANHTERFFNRVSIHVRKILPIKMFLSLSLSQTF